MYITNSIGDKKIVDGFSYWCDIFPNYLHFVEYTVYWSDLETGDSKSGLKYRFDTKLQVYDLHFGIPEGHPLRKISGSCPQFFDEVYALLGKDILSNGCHVDFKRGGYYTMMATDKELPSSITLSGITLTFTKEENNG